MVGKPISGDEEQRRAQTRAARFQSGLPPEEELETPAGAVNGKPASEPGTAPETEGEDAA